MEKVNTGGLDDLENPETITIPKALYDRLLMVAKVAADRLNAKDALYAFEKDLEKAMHKLKSNNGEKE